MPLERCFDQAYYDRFYRDPKTRVATRSSIDRLGAFVCNYLKHLDQPARSVLDIGCGIGLWRPVIRRHFPRARYTGVEISDYLCKRYGWQRGSVVDWRAPRPYDLVICHGVLQYLPAPAASRAVTNLARLCCGALYLEALTTEDWEQHCDQRVTDGNVYLRRAAWYRRRLRAGFTACGGGVFLSHKSTAVPYELEQLR